MIAWKQWKRGLAVAAATGLLAGGTGLAVGVTWKQAGWIVGLSIGKDLLLYLTDSGYRDKILASLPSNGNGAPTASAATAITLADKKDS